MAEETQGTSQQLPEKASGMAIAALVLGIVGICCSPAAIAAWVVGHIERGNIKKGNSPEAGMGMATAGWVLGIVFTIVNILVGIAYGVLVVIAMMAGASGSGAGF